MAIRNSIPITLQRQLLILLSMKEGSIITACDLMEVLKKNGHAVSVRTVQRDLVGLEEVGLVELAPVEKITSSNFWRWRSDSLISKISDQSNAERWRYIKRHPNIVTTLSALPVKAWDQKIDREIRNEKH